MDAGSVVVGLKLDRRDFDKGLNKVQSFTPSLNLDLKTPNTKTVGKEIKKINKGGAIRVTVDHKPLNELNAHLDKKLAHVKQLQKYFNQNPLRVGFLIDSSIPSSSFTSRQNSTQNSTKIETKADNYSSELIKTIIQASSGQIKAIEELHKTTKKSSNPIASIGRGLFEKVGSSLFNSAKNSVKNNLGFDFDAIAEPSVKFISKFVKRITPEAIKSFEDNIVSALEQGFVFGDNSKMRSQLMDAFKPLRENITEMILESVSPVVYAGAQPLRIRKRVELARSAKKAAEEAKSNPLNLSSEEESQIQSAKSIALITGGIDFQKGGVNTYFAENLVKRILPDAYSVPVTNPWSNDKESLGAISKLIRQLPGMSEMQEMPLERLLQVAVELGYNPDSIKMAAEAMKYAEKFPDKPINLFGTSGGSYVVEEAVSILQRAGVKNVKGSGLTAPFAGLTNTATPGSFISNVGEIDPLFIAMFGGNGVSEEMKQSIQYQKTLEALPIPFLLKGLLKPGEATKMIPGAGLGHALLPFLAEEEVQKNLESLLGGDISKISEDFKGQQGIRNLDFLRIMQDERFTIPRTLAALFNDTATLNQIEQQGFTGAEGYTFAVPQKPEWARQYDLEQAQKRNIRKKGKNTSGSVKDIFTEYDQFISEMIEGITEWQSSGGKVKDKLLKVLNKASAMYPELHRIQMSVLETAKAYAETTLALQSEDISIKDRYKLQKRKERIESQYPKGFSDFLSSPLPEIPIAASKNIDSSEATKQATVSITEQVSKESLIEKASNIQAGFKDYSQQLKNEIQAAQELGDFELVSQKARDFAVYAAKAKHELEQIRKQLIEIGAIAKNDSSNPASKAKSQITTATKSLQREFAKSGNSFDLVGEVNKESAKIIIDSAVEVGQNLSKGVAVGIEKDSIKASKSAQELMIETEKSAEKQAEIQSPSKVFIRIGKYLSSGLAVGISKGKDSAKSAMELILQEIAKIKPREQGSDSILEWVGRIGKFLKGIVAFSAASWAQNFFGDIAKQAFNAYVEVDRLRTSLNFSSNSKFAGAQNLKFATNTANNLGISLKPTQEGFASLNAAARGTALQGQGIKELFTGMAQASTVLSMSTEQSERAFTALTQVLSKGKVSSEELRQQLAESGLVGAMGIAARAVGVTEEEFNRLLESGQVLSQDFLPKFAKQLQAEFGDAAKDASNNAQSAIYKFENSYIELQQTLGEAVAPAAVAGLNAMTGAMNLLKSIGTELGIVVVVLATVLSVKMLAGLFAVIKGLMAANFAGKGFIGTVKGIGAAINNSFSAKLAVGLFGVLEIINLLNQAVNTELVRSFEDAAAAAKRAADESRKALLVDAAKSSQKETRESKKEEFKPRSSNWFGQLMDNVFINPLNATGMFDAAELDSQGKPTGKIKQLTSYGDLEKSRTEIAIDQVQEQAALLLNSGGIRLSQLQSGDGNIGKLPEIDKQLTQAEQQRQILQAQAKRDYTDKGLAVPAEVKQQIQLQNATIAQLNQQRSDIAKPFTLDITRTNQQIASVKAQIEALQSPEALAVLGTDKSMAMQEQLKATLKRLEEFKAKAESALASLKVDPVLAFTNALRQLNLAFNKSQEANQTQFNQQRSQITKTQNRNFSSDRYANKNAAIDTAIAEEEKAFKDLQSLQTAVADFDKASSSPEFQSTLQRLGLTKDSSVAQIEDILQNTQDEADKKILEQFKAGKELSLRRDEAQANLAEAEGKRLGANQDLSLTKIQDAAKKQELALQKSEANRTKALKSATMLRLITESQAAEETAKIQLQTTTAQQANLATQIKNLKSHFNAGKISAEEYHRQLEDLTSQQTNLEVQAQEQRLQAFEAANRRKLEEIETANAKAQATIDLNQTNAITDTKTGILTGQTSEQQAARQQNQVEQQAIASRISLVKKQIQQTKDLEATKVISAKDSTDKQIQLNQQLAQSNQELIDKQIQAQELLRAAIDKTFARRKAQLELDNTKADNKVNQQFLNNLKTGNFTDLRSLELDSSVKSLQNRSKFLKDQERIIKDQIAGIDQLKLAEEDAGDKRRELTIELENLRKEQISTEKDLILQSQEQQINAIERTSQIRTASLEKEKSLLDLYNQSLERTSKLEESRYNLTKAMSDASLTGREIELDKTNRAFDLAKRLEDRSLKGRDRRNAKKELKELGYGGKSAKDILEERAQLESTIAFIKLDALKKEQAFQQQALAMDLKRQKVASQMAVLEAETAKLQAQQELQTARAKGDRVGEEIALNKVELADAKIGLAVQSLADFEELAGNATQAQLFSQSAESNKLNADINRTALDTGRAFGEVRRGKFKMPSIPPLTPEQPRNIAINQLDLKPKQGEDIYQTYMRQRQEMEDLSKKPQANDNATGFKGLVEGLKAANRGVEERLERLIANFDKLATPRSLTVTTANPVDDAAKIVNDVSRMGLKSAGV